MRGRADQGCRVQAGFLGDGWGRGEEGVPGMENRVFKGPAAKREQSLWKERTLVWLETRQRREGERAARESG